ncbi:MAG: DUF4230 domain-containing protein [Erysipelotrichaceae bacterium]|nr:DUF4230 domain-containing protein [Erysipelotrichaceae bacterium]
MSDNNKLIDRARTVGKKKVSIASVVIVLLIIAVLVFFVSPKVFNKGGKQEVATLSTLEKVVKTSTLSTYQTVYNGIAEIRNSEKPEKVDYYVAYTATVKAGLDFNQITITRDDESHRFIVSLPKITLQEPTVRIEEMDFIIVNRRIKQEAIAADAYSRYIADVSEESEKQQAIYDYARQNAENLIRGLLQPFVDQLDGEYSIEFEQKGQ